MLNHDQRKHRIVLLKRLNHLENRVEEAAREGRRLDYDIAEVAALRFALAAIDACDRHGHVPSAKRKGVER